MARARGNNATLLLALESVYGAAEDSGAYWKMPFNSLDIGGEQGKIPSEVLGLGREPRDPVDDLLRVGGSITVPLDVRYIGYWLKALLAAPTTTGIDPYTHTFDSGGASLPSLCLEVGYINTPHFDLITGLYVESIQFGLSRSGRPVMVIQVSAQDETKDTSTVDADPNELTLTMFSQIQGTIERNAAALANVNSVDLTYANGLEAIETIRDDELVEDHDPGMTSLIGSINSRYAATTLYDDAVAGSSLDLDLAWTIDADNKLTISAHRCFLERFKRPIQGAGGVQATTKLSAHYDPTETQMATIVLINDVATYVNAV